MPQLATNHVRFNYGLLAGSERRLLEWIARRLPDWITPDHLSAVGLASMAAAGVAFAAFTWSASAAAWAVVAALAANWFGDSLDGTVARVRRTERPRYGYYVDHVIDLAGTAFLFSGMASSGLMSPLLALSLLATYLLVCAETYLATHATGVFRMSFFGFGPTELRVLLAIGAVKAAHGMSVTIAGYGVRLFDVGAAMAIAGLAVTFIVSAVRNSRALYRAEPVQRPVTRRALVTDTYDTEHMVTFERLSATDAASRSVATRIEETGQLRRSSTVSDASRWRGGSMPCAGS